MHKRHEQRNMRVQGGRHHISWVLQHSTVGAGIPGY